MSDDGSQSIGSDDFLWYIARDPNGVSAFFEQHSLDLDTVNKIVLAIIKLDSRHFDKAWKLQLNYENRPYGYNLSDFSQTLPWSFIRQVKQSIEQAFGKASQ